MPFPVPKRPMPFPVPKPRTPYRAPSHPFPHPQNDASPPVPEHPPSVAVCADPNRSETDEADGKRFSPAVLGRIFGVAYHPLMQLMEENVKKRLEEAYGVIEKQKLEVAAMMRCHVDERPGERARFLQQEAGFDRCASFSANESGF